MASNIGIGQNGEVASTWRYYENL